MLKFFVIALSILIGCNSSSKATKARPEQARREPMEVSISEPRFAGAEELMNVAVKVEIKKLESSVQLYNVFLLERVPQPANLCFIDAEGKETWAYQVGFRQLPSAKYWTYLCDGDGISTTYAARFDSTKCKLPVKLKLVVFREMENLCPDDQAKMDQYNKRYSSNQMNKEPWVESNELVIKSFRH